MWRSIVIAALLVPATSHAQGVAPDGEARNYDQVPKPETTSGPDVVGAIGVGISYFIRVLLAPIEGAVYLQARYEVATKLEDLVTNDAKTLGIYPDGSYETDFGLSYGARAFAKQLTSKDDELQLSAKTGGAFKYAAQLRYDAQHFAELPIYVHTRARYEDNINLYFAGIGNGPKVDGMELGARDSSFATRFSQKRFLALVSTGVDLFGDHLRIGGTGIYNHRTFGPSGSGAGDPSIETVYNTATINGYNNGFDNLEMTGDIELDTRDVRGPATSGALVRAFMGGASLVDSPSYAHYGAEAIGFIEPGWQNRVLVARVMIDGVIDRNDDIPFTELPRLGGANMLRGYHTDQFRDKIATEGTLEYRYPIHNNLSGALYVDAGKVGRTMDAVYGSGLTDNWHLGYGIGMFVHTAKSVLVRIDLSYGDGVNFYFVTDVLDAFRHREREL